MVSRSPLSGLDSACAAELQSSFFVISLAILISYKSYLISYCRMVVGAPMS